MPSGSQKTDVLRAEHGVVLDPVVSHAGAVELFLQAPEFGDIADAKTDMIQSDSERIEAIPLSSFWCVTLNPKERAIRIDDDQPRELQDWLEAQSVNVECPRPRKVRHANPHVVEAVGLDGHS